METSFTEIKDVEVSKVNEVKLGFVCLILTWSAQQQPTHT